MALRDRHHEWETIRYALGSGRRTLRLCCIFFVIRVLPAAIGALIPLLVYMRFSR